MKFRRLTASDLASLLDLYKQLDEDDDECPMDQSEEAWKEIEANANIQYFGASKTPRFLLRFYYV